MDIYRLLGSLSSEANLIDESIDWTKKYQESLDPKVHSEAKRSLIVARLASLNLRKPTRNADEEGLLLALLDSLERPFKGDLSELEDLVTEISAVRRAAISLLAKARTTTNDLTNGMEEMCEALVLLCPRMSLRYLGTPPDVNSATKEIVRYEQRRQFIKKSSMHAIDSTLFLIRNFQGEGRSTWDLMDSKLQDCLLLLERLDADSGHTSPAEGVAQPSYYLRISNLYYSQYLNMRRDSENSKDSQQLRALKRSLDCVRSRPQFEKRAAQYSMKLERIADIYKTNGRFDELFNTLVSLRDESISNGALSAVAAAAATQAIRAAWSQDDETTLLARSIQSLIKVQFKCLDPKSQTLLYDGPWSDDERGALLEHHLDVLGSQTNKSNASWNLQNKIFQALLALYNLRMYPIRRLRVLTRLLSLDLGQRHVVSDNLSNEIICLQGKSLAIEGTRDEGLRDYLTHLRTLITTQIELQQDQPRQEIFKQCLAVWFSIRSQCADFNALERQIEDVQSFLIHLQSLADYMEMKGFGTTRVTILRLIANFNELRNDSLCPNDLVVSFTSLGMQWLQLGYSGKAGLALDRAESYSHQNGIVTESLLNLNLSYSEYLLAIGNYCKRYELLVRLLKSEANMKQ